MPYSLRTKLKHLACERDITVKEYERLIKALDVLDAVEEIKAEIKEVGYTNPTNFKAYEKWGCSECHTVFRFTFQEHDYCPNCGARMESEDKE